VIVPVNSRVAPYQVHIASGALNRLDESLGDAVRVAVIVPEPLAHLAQRTQELCRQRRVITITVPDAEAAKAPAVLVKCWDELASAGFTRSDLVVGLGGGTTTDLAGFVAASWLRGVGFISIPTTVLGMVDAAVGGKTGINLTAGKNLVGAFHEPQTVLCDLDLLRDLPGREIASGLAEVVKCGFISDAEILRLVDSDLQRSLDVTSDVFAELVGRAVAVKAGVVAEDLTERTSSGESVGREALNYGHTLGHAVEAHEGFRLRHGQAISIGMTWIAEVSRRLLGLDSGFASDHARLLGALGLPTSYDVAAWPELRRLMSLDKKSRGTSLRLAGLAAQGHPVILDSPDENELAESYAAVSGRG
jgi:3-dehydroquinate synthase